MTSFYSRLSYSFGNEDWETELEALQIQKGDHVVCVTASGDRPLHLLLSRLEKIVSIDANPIQNYLLWLKKTAIQELDYPSYLQFLGALPCKQRVQTFKQIASKMDCQAVQYWQTNLPAISKGVLYQGSMERVCQKFATFLRLTCSKKINKLFEYEDIEEQKRFVKKEWDKFWWRLGFNITLNTKTTRYIVNDPCLYVNIDSQFRNGPYMHERFKMGLSKFLAKDNHLLSIFFRGHVSKSAYPPYLQEKGMEAIRSQLKRLSNDGQYCSLSGKSPFKQHRLLFFIGYSFLHESK